MADFHVLTDTELVAEMRQGKDAAFTEIYNRYKWLLHTHAYKKLGDREAANDIIQEVFANLWSNRSQLQITSNLPGYLYKAVRNTILNFIAHQEIVVRYEDSIKSFAQTGPEPTDALTRERQLKLQIDQEIANLPPKMREVFELSRNLYLSHKQIGAVLNISEETVKKQVKNSLKILRLRLKYLFLFLM